MPTLCFCVLTLHSSAERLWYSGHPDTAKWRSCFPVRWPIGAKETHTHRTTEFGGRVWLTSFTDKLVSRLATRVDIIRVTQRVASWSGTLHVEIVGLVATPAFGPVRKVLVGVSVGRVLWLALIVRGVGAGYVQLGLWRWSVACRGQRRGLVMVTWSLQVWGIYMDRREVRTRSQLAD